MLSVDSFNTLDQFSNNGKQYNFFNLSKLRISTFLFSNNSLQNLDMNFYLYTNIIPKIDIAGMANGLEIRPPYLDDRIIEFGKNIKTHTSLFKTKLFLREYIKNTDISF